MIGKSVFLLALLVVIIAVANSQPSPYNSRYAPSNNKSHHLSVGYRQKGDRLVLRQNVTKPAQWMQVVTVQKLFGISKYEKITLVQALDQKTNGNGAYAYLENGGPGRNNVTLRFQSQKGHGINFYVDIYAKP